MQEGITSRVLEGLAVAISLTRGDFAVANTTGFLLALGEYLSDSTARRSDKRHHFAQISMTSDDQMFCP